MWRSFKDWPIQRKLTGMALFSTGLALLLALVAFVVNDMVALRNMIETRMTVLTDVIGTNSTAALTFRDQKAAAETLAALRQAPHITFAEIYTADRNTFASYTRAGQTSRQTPPDHAAPSVELKDSRQSRFADHQFEQTAPITMDGQRIGWILLRYELDEMDQQLTRSAMIALAILLVSSLTALTVSRRLQRAITDPLLRLVATTRTVSETGNYSLRAEAFPPHDEIGVLIKGLNAMLEQIQSQHSLLQRHREVLEMEVAQRTEDLSQTLRTMQETQHFLTSMIEHLPIMVFVKDARELKFSRWNRAAEELTGYTREEMLGKCDHDFFPKEEADFFTAKDRQVLTNAQVLDVPEEPIHTKHRGIRILRTKKLSILDDQGHPQFLIGIAEDITEHKQAEAALREQMQLSLLAADINETLAHGATLPEILRHCVVSLVRHLDVAFARIWLLNPGDLCHECHKASACANHTQCLHLAASAGLSENLNGEYRRIPLGALKIGKIAQGWGTMTTNDVVNDERLPNKQWLTEQGLQAFAGYPLKIGTQVIGVMALFSRHALSTPVTDTLERIAQVVSIGVERKRTEEALQASEERLALTVQGSNIGIWDRNLITNTVYFSPQWKRQLGHDNHEIENAWSAWESRLHPDDRDTARYRIQSTIDSSQSRFELEYRLRHADGSYRWMLSRGALLRDAYGVASRMIGIHIDTTEDKRAQEELRQAKETAESASKAKSEFLANMSHEIRTPMNGVLGMAELLLNSPLTEKQRHLADSVHRSGTALLGIINDILDFSKIEAGKLELEQIEFGLRSTIEEAVDLFADPAGKKGLELTCYIPDGIPDSVIGDPTRIRQVLLNLVGNAVKFTHRGEVTVRVALLSQKSETLELRVEVADTGLGIPAQIQPRLFTAFSQADGSTTRRFGGTGLGLAIVKQLVQLMGGDVGLASSSDTGSTFWFTLRLGYRAADDIRDVSDSQFLNRTRILIVDDNPTNRYILESHLKAWGADTVSAESGAVALSLLHECAGKHAPIDLAILDVHMPDMNGIMLAKAIKTDPDTRDVDLLALSSIDRQPQEADNTAHDFSVWLRKPVRQSLLKDCLRRRLSRASALPTAQTPMPTAQTPALGRVLLVEDNPVNREVTTGMLELIGYHITVAEDGQQALTVSATDSFDLILMDCQMPIMDGFTTTAAIRKREQDTQSPRTPMIALTANAMEGDRERCLAAGMDDYLSKPFSRRALAEMLSRWRTPRIPAQASVTQTTLETPAVSEKRSSTTIPVDRTVWASITALQRPGKPNLLHKTINLYLTSSHKQIDDIRHALQIQDLQTILATAHTLKSSSATLGAIRLATLAGQLETTCRTGPDSQAMKLFSLIETEHQQVSTILQEELATSTEEAA